MLAAPYKLTVKVIEAENLPIADITTSDPYVNVMLGDKLMERTKTIKRNHLHPVWNEEFELPVLHRNTFVEFRLFDEDVGDDDDLMGLVSIELSTLPLNKNVAQKYNVVNCGKFKAKATLHISLFFVRQEDLVKIVRNESIPVGSDLAIEELKRELSTKSKSNPLSEVTEIVTQTVQEFLGEEKEERARHLKLDFIQDLLDDVRTLNPALYPEVPTEPLSTENIYPRNKLRLINTSKCDLNSGTFKNCIFPPYVENSIQINIASSEDEELGEDPINMHPNFLLIKLPNRFSMWNWMKWLQVAHQVWTGFLTQEEIPDWVISNNNSISSYMTIIHCDNGVINTFSDQRGTLSLENAFDFKYGPRRFSLQNMAQLICSVDSVRPKPYIVEFSFPNISDANESMYLDEETKDPYNSKEPKTDIKGKQNDLNKKSSGFASCFCSSSQSVVETAHSPATATRQGSISRRASLTPMASQTMRRKHRLLAIKCRDESFVIDYSIPSSNKIFLDIDVKELDFIHRPSLMTISERRSIRPESFNVNRHQSSTSFHKLSMEMYLLSGIEGMEKILAQKKYYLNDMIAYSVFGGSSNNASRPSFFDRKAGKYFVDSAMSTDLDLNQCFGLAMNLVNARDLVLPNKGKSKCIYAKARLADATGQSSVRAKQTEQRTANYTVSSNVQFQNFLFTFLPDNYATGKEDFVLIELFVEEGNGSHTCVGSAFIPIESFLTKESEYTIPLSRFNCAPSVYMQAIKQGAGLGDITIQLKKMEEEVDNSRERIMCQSILHECSIFNSSWFAECLPVGAINSENVVIDRALVSVAYQGLKLTPLETDSIGNIGKSSENNFDRAVSHNTITFNYDGPLEVMIEVFENQRRQPLPPFDWSPTTLTTPPFSDLLFNVSYSFNNLEDAVPPQGANWISDWMVDSSYTQTDEDGWCYGFTFSKVLENLKRKQSCTVPTNTHARRRKWVRKARFSKDDEEHFINVEQMIYAFQIANSKKDENSANSSESAVTRGMDGKKSSSRFSDNWRRQVASSFPGSILLTCKERLGVNADVIIDWNQIKYWAVVTSSILSITIQVERFFSEMNGTNPYRPAEVELFISNCNARELRKWLDERKWFNRIRHNIRGLISSGNMFGKQPNEKKVPEEASKAIAEKVQTTNHVNDDDSSVGYVSENEKDDDGEEKAEEEAEDIPETEDLSMGSETLAMLDDQLIALQQRLDGLEEETENVVGTPMEEQFELEKLIIFRQICRLRLYMAALVGVGLQGVHNFHEHEIRSIMEADFRKAQNIELENDVATANNRIEYLLDMAEKRIRDAALCGWNHRGGDLENALTLFANGYFIEIVSVLGSFFEDRGQTNVKGLTSKVELITTFMKHNDRLDMIIESALRPYGLKSDPPAKLTMFLDFTVLSQWYTSVLNMEMRMRVDDTFNVWKDLEKDVTGQADMYKYSLPWIPQQTRGLFFSHIAEDLVEVLTTYLTFARLTKANVAPAFHDSLGKLDSKVCLAYINSFLYLSEGYQKALKQKQYLLIKEEDELTEYNTWLCSFSNDTLRIVVNETADPITFFQRIRDDSIEEKTEEQTKLLNRCNNSYTLLRLEALDQLSCTLFICIFHERQTLFSEGILPAWKKYYANHSADEPTFLSSIVDDAIYFTESHKDFLEPVNYHALLQIMVDKLLVIFFTIIFDACKEGEIYDIYDAFFNNLLREGEALKAKLEAMLSYPLDDAIKSTNTLACLEIIPNLMELFSYEDLNSVEMDKAITGIKKSCEHSKTFSAAVATCLEQSLGLRGVKYYFTKEQRQKIAPAPAVIPQPRRASLSGFKNVSTSQENIASTSKDNNAVSSTPGIALEPSPPRAPSSRRTSFVQSFFLRGATPEPQQQQQKEAIPTGFDMLGSSSAESINMIDDEADLEKVREAAIVACIDAVIQSIRADSIANTDKPVSSRLWIGKSSIERVFGEESKTTWYTLGAQLVQSAMDVSKRTFKSDPTASNRTGTPTQSMSVFSLFMSSSNQNLSRGSSNSQLTDHSVEAELTIIITDLKIFNLFYMDMFRNPKPYLSFSVNGFNVKTKSKDAENHADWSGEPPVQLKIFNSSSSLLEIEIDLIYEGILSDNVVGTLKIPFNPHDPPTYRGKQFTITDYWKSSKANQASKRATAEGRSLPTLQLSLDCISSKTL